MKIFSGDCSRRWTKGQQSFERGVRSHWWFSGSLAASLFTSKMNIININLISRLIYYYWLDVLSIIYYCRHCPRMYFFKVFCIFLLILDIEHDIGGEEFYHCVPATNWYADLFYESFTERIIVQKNVAFARFNNRKRRMTSFFKLFEK